MCDKCENGRKALPNVHASKRGEIFKDGRARYIAESARQCILSVTRATREHRTVRLVGSTRSALGLQAASQALAACRGRDFVIPDDVTSMAVPVLCHRIILKTEARLKGRTEEDLLRAVLDAVPVPSE
jgi:MoxR-like ATPase